MQAWSWVRTIESIGAAEVSAMQSRMAQVLRVLTVPTVQPVLTAPPAEGPVRVPTRAKAMAAFLAIVDATTLAYCHMVRHG